MNQRDIPPFVGADCIRRDPGQYITSDLWIGQMYSGGLTTIAVVVMVPGKLRERAERYIHLTPSEKAELITALQSIEADK